MKKSMEDTQRIPVINTEDYNYTKHYEHSTASQKQPKIKQNNKTVNKTFKSFIITILIIFLTLSIGLYAMFSRVNYEPVQKGFTINTTNIKNQIYNVLLIGTDKEENGSSRSDSMILISVNKKSNKIKMTSFMRDLWVKIPDNEAGRLNSSYTIGGAGLLIDTLESNFDIQIDDYVLVDFEMFKQLIDELGGITVDITEKEAEFINRTTKSTVKSGENTLSGNDALIYCRIRKLDSDFMRTQRQRKVMNAILDKVKNQNIISTASVGFNILPLITTDISPLKMILKSPDFISAVTYDVEQLRIPADNTYSNKRINSQAVLVADFEANTNLIHEFIYN